MYENSDSFRERRRPRALRRSTPTVTLAAGDRTRITLGYEYLHDTRVADRGITSFQGRPADVDIVDLLRQPGRQPRPRDGRPRLARRSSTRSARLTLRNRTLFGDYDRFYQNYVPGAVTPTRTRSRSRPTTTPRTAQNVFNQTDVTYTLSHRLACSTRCWPAPRSAGSSPTTSATPGSSTTPRRRSWCRSTTRRSRTPSRSARARPTPTTTCDTNVAATYVQDQVELVGARPGGRRAALRPLRPARTTTTGTATRSTASTISSRRAPASSSSRSRRVSLYGSYSVSYLPSSGDQFSSLTHDHRAGRSRRSSPTTRSGVKWDVAPGLLADDRASTGWIAPTRARPIRTIRPASCRRAASARTASSSGVNGRVDVGVERRRRLRLSGRVRDERHRRGARGRAGRPRCRTTRFRCGTTTSSCRSWRPALGVALPLGHVRDHRQHGDAARLHARRCRGVRQR